MKHPWFSTRFAFSVDSFLEHAAGLEKKNNLCEELGGPEIII